jgi:hypothetical protein
MNQIAKFLFENSPFDAFVSAWWVGFCVVGFDGMVYRTEAGQDYLESIE